MHESSTTTHTATWSPPARAETGNRETFYAADVDAFCRNSPLPMGRWPWPARAGPPRPRPSVAPADLDDRSSGGDLDTCHAARVQRDQPVAVATTEHAGVVSQRLDDLVDELGLVALIGVLVGQVRVVATKEPNPKHDACHARTVVREKPR